MTAFVDQVRLHCHNCGVPLRGHGELAMSTDPDAREQVSETHLKTYHLKKASRRLELVTRVEQLGSPLAKVTDYIGNARRD